jgi:hypothetical protein
MRSASQPIERPAAVRCVTAPTSNACIHIFRRKGQKVADFSVSGADFGRNPTFDIDAHRVPVYNRA